MCFSSLFYAAFLFFVSSWFIAQMLFCLLHPSCSSVPGYLLCVPAKGFVRVGPRVSTYRLLYSSLRKYQATLSQCSPRDLSPESMGFMLSQWLPVDAFIGCQKFRPPACLTNQSPGINVGTTKLLLPAGIGFLIYWNRRFSERTLCTWTLTQSFIVSPPGTFKGDNLCRSEILML